MNNDRLSPLIAIWIASLLALVGAIARPQTPFPQVRRYVFPKTVPLPHWQLVTTHRVNNEMVQSPAYISGTFLSGKHYRYQQGQASLEIAMRYFANTDGDLKSFIKSQTGDLSSVLRQHSGIGTYSLFSDNQRTYLSACIGPKGGSTVTADRFKRDRTLYDIRPQQFIRWLQGQANLTDKRCLWAHLSLPLKHYPSQTAATEAIETAWFSWYRWWRAKFPDP